MIGHFERSHVDVPEEHRPEVVLISIDGHLPDVRTRIMGEAVIERCTHLLFLDSDMIFPPDTLHRLLRHNLPIVGANYPRRIFPHLPTAHYGGPDAQGGVVWSENKTGVERVKHVGFGCVLMDMRLVDAIDPPYFVFAPDGEHGLTTRGEDVYFCEKLLRDAGIDSFTIYEKSDGVGGTWRDNSYPHAACDVPSHLYSFSFASKADWTRKFARQPEILGYFESLVDRFDLARHLRLGVEVTEAHYDDADGTWTLHMDGPPDSARPTSRGRVDPARSTPTTSRPTRPACGRSGCCSACASRPRRCGRPRNGANRPRGRTCCNWARSPATTPRAACSCRP